MNIRQFSAWLTDVLHERMQANAEAMMADGWTQEEVAAQLAEWQADADRCHSETVAQVKRVMNEPDAPNHTLQ